MSKITGIFSILFLSLTFNISSVLADDYTMTPDGSYVGGSDYTMTPDGSYVGNNR